MVKRCIACGAKLKVFGETPSATIYRCTRCGLGVTSGPARTQTRQYHRDWVYAKREKQFKNIFEKRARIVQGFAARGEVLEVGSSTGILLSLLKQKGWGVYGIEPSQTAATLAKKRGIPTIVSEFEKARMVGKKYDVVIFNHTLEHMRNPLVALRKARSLLKSRGIIFVDAPNFASFSARIAGPSWKYILPDEHLWHFTASSLFNLLNKTGFSPLWWEAHSGIWGYAHPWQEIWESLSGGKKRFFTNVLTLLPTWLITKVGVGTGLSVVARKA